MRSRRASVYGHGECDWGRHPVDHGVRVARGRMSSLVARMGMGVYHANVNDWPRIELDTSVES